MSKFSYLIQEYIKMVRPPISGVVSRFSNQALHSTVLDLCEKAKIAAPNSILIFEEAFSLPNAGMSSRGDLFLGKKLLEALEYNNTDTTISKELQAIIGHELGHSTRIRKDTALIMGTMMGAPLLLYAGYKLYEHAKHRKEEKGHGNIQQHIEISGKEADKELSKHIDEQTPAERAELHGARKLVMRGIKEMALYAAASIAAIPITKFVGRNVEFAADKFGAELVGKEHMASALTKVEEKATAIMDAGGVPKILQKAFRLMDYHPSTASRIGQLSRI